MPDETKVGQPEVADAAVEEDEDLRPTDPMPVEAGFAGARAEILNQLGVSEEMSARHRAPRWACTWSPGGVDLATGKVMRGRRDFELGGPWPIRFERMWVSASTYQGPLGHGVHHGYDLALARAGEHVGVRLADGRVIWFRALSVGESDYNAAERITLQRHRFEYRLRDVSGVEQRFAQHRGQAALVLSTLRNASGQRLRFGYDARARLCRITDSADRVIQLAYDGTDRIQEISGPHPLDGQSRIALLRCDYDSRGNLIEVWDALAQPQRFVYRGPLLVRETDRTGFTRHFSYDGASESARCIRSWGEGGMDDHAIDYEGPITMMRNSLGQISTYVHDEAVVRQVFDPLGRAHTVERGLGYRVERELNAQREEIRYEYDARGNLIEVTGPDGARCEVVYGEGDRPARVIDPLGGQWTFSYDATGRLRRRNDPTGAVMRFHHRGPWPIGITDAAGNYMAFGYDHAGNLDWATAPDGTTQRHVYDGWGRLTAVIDPKGNERSRELDVLGRVVRTHGQDGRVCSYEHDAEGRVTARIRSGEALRFTYAPSGGLVSCNQADRMLHFEYDTEGRLTSIVTERAEVTRFSYGSTGLLERESHADGKTRELTRDKAGRVVRIEQAGVGSSALDYDASGRLIRVSHSDGSTERFGYRADGALTMASNEHAVVGFERDALGRVVRERQGTHEIESEYDAIGARIRVRSSLGPQLVFERASSGDVLRLAETTSGFEARFERDVLGLELERSLPGPLASRWQRDPFGRPTEHLVQGPDGVLSSYAYRWNLGSGPPMEAAELEPRYRGFAEYASSAARCASSGVDVNAQVRSLALAHVPMAGLTPIGRAWNAHLIGRAYGRMQARRCASNASDVVYVSDAARAGFRIERDVAGRIRALAAADGTRISFTYDALGRMIAKRYRGQTTHWIWDGTNRLHEWVEGALSPVAQRPRELAVSERVEGLAARDRVCRTMAPASGHERAVKYKVSAAAPRRARSEPHTVPTKPAVPMVLSPAATPAQCGEMHSRARTVAPTLPTVDLRSRLPVAGPWSRVGARSAYARALEARLGAGGELRGSRATPITWVYEPRSSLPIAKLIGRRAWSILRSCDGDGAPVLIVDERLHVFFRAEDAAADPFACPFRRAGYTDPETGLCHDNELHPVLRSPALSDPWATARSWLSPLPWRERALHGVHELGVTWLDGGGEASPHLALAIDHELGEVPLNVAGAVRSGLLTGEELVEWCSLGPFDVQLGEQRERHVVA